MTTPEEPIQRGRANKLLDAEQLDAISSRPATECERCSKEFIGDRHLITVTGHYVTGSDWEVCSVCTADLMAWLTLRADFVIRDPRPPAPAPDQRKKHQ